MAAQRPNPLIYWLPVVFFMGVIFYQSCLPAKDIPALFPFQDVTYHFLIYSLLCFLFCRALIFSYPLFSLKKVILITFLFALSYGVSDEVHQYFVPQRCVSGFDVFIDSLGGISGSIFYLKRHTGVWVG